MISYVLTDLIFTRLSHNRHYIYSSTFRLPITFDSVAARCQLELGLVASLIWKLEVIKLSRGSSYLSRRVDGISEFVAV